MNESPMEKMGIPLHPIERSILFSLAKQDIQRVVDVKQLANIASLSIDQVRRGIEWLKAKGLIETEEKEVVSLSLGSEGESAVEVGMPERRLVKIVKDAGGVERIPVISKSLGNEFAVALGRAKKNDWVRIENDNVSLNPFADNKEPEELLLEKIRSASNISKDDLDESELQIVNELRKRREGFVHINRVKSVAIKLSSKGKSIAVTVSPEEIDNITPLILKSGEWKNRPLRALDVTSPAPKLFGGRKHPMRIFMDEVRETFVSLGFEEILGPMCQSALWNFDSLFIPQEHSAREMQDTFYILNAKAKLDEFRAQIQAIRNAHENGAGTGSSGWRYRWKEEEATRVVLRTHTTAVTISYLAKFNPEEAKVFTLGRVFRNEKSNYKHNPEFFQIEGVMVGEKLNLRNLIFILTRFYSKIGFNEIKFWPTYFPYTEPSLQTMVFIDKTKKWMELGGMGIFRPEVTLPIGVKNPVLAWGLSLDRLVMLRHGVGDIRQLFGANLDWLRELPVLKV
ncbi:MAG: phenylalanine--tRNA ligase subunit alpha [Nitrososphaerales archaeon]